VLAVPALLLLLLGGGAYRDSLRFAREDPETSGPLTTLQTSDVDSNEKHDRSFHKASEPVLSATLNPAEEPQDGIGGSLYFYRIFLRVIF
jgi:hypothetical protein